MYGKDGAPPAGDSKRNTYRRILALIRPYRLYVAMAIVCAAATTAAQLVIPILTGSAIDHMIGIGRVDFGAVRILLLKIAACAAAASVTQFFLRVCNNKAAFGVSRDLRDAAAEKLPKVPLRYLDAHMTGDILSRVTADVDLFADGLLLGFTQLFTGVLTILGTLFFMLYVNVPIALIVVCATPLSLVVAAFIAKKTYRYFHEQSEVRGDETSYADERIMGVKVVQAFGRESETLAEFDRKNARLRDVSFRAVFYSSITNPSTRFVNSIVYAGVGLFGAMAAVAGSITVGELSVFLTYANQYTKPFNEISGVVTELQNAVACAERLFEFLDAPEEEPDARTARVLRPDTVDGRVVMDHISFRYVPEKPLIEDLALTVEKGQRIAIVGPTGSGKTTLINLLMRFYDVDAGEIRVSGTEIRSVTRDSLRASFGMVLQETWLKSATVFENIAYGKPDATMEEVEEAARRAHAHSFIRRLPEGYRTELTEDGGNLSEGQKQLLCIARVMLSLPPMLILDEATSSIDTRTERRIQKAFDAMMEGRTSFVVAHRLSTIEGADCILVLKDGRIIEQGTHQELLSAKGFYADLYEAQFAHA
ncbi:MAG: ABC transporter ATP-binding protein [Lachnospiraceae bacterium]|nr:ABC transporter ATP-binding protein [Lachnospiraceae bacterium]